MIRQDENKRRTAFFTVYDGQVEISSDVWLICDRATGRIVLYMNFVNISEAPATVRRLRA